MQTRPNMHRANSPSPCTSILEFNRCRDVPPRIAPRYNELFVCSNHFVICGLIFLSRRKWKSKMKTDARKNSDIDSTSFSPWPLSKRLVKSMRIDTNRKIWYPMDQFGSIPQRDTFIPLVDRFNLVCLIFSEYGNEILQTRLSCIIR